MDLKIDKDLSVVGNLCYRFFEKDKNDGTVIGKLQGDTLADYTFYRRELLPCISCVCKRKYVCRRFGDITTDSTEK
jgi:hypothetical protein